MRDPRLIDMHGHCLPAEYLRAAGRAGMRTFDGGMPIPRWNLGLAVEFMDRRNIAVQVLSVSSPPVHLLVGTRGAARLARRVNEAVAGLVATRPGRFRAVAALPLPDLRAAVEEVQHAVDVLGFVGVTLFTNYAGRYLGDPFFEPLLAVLNERDVLVLLHPTSPVAADRTRLGRPSPVIEFPLDTTRTVVDMIYAGVLLRHPRLRIVVPHAGAALPALSWRIARFAADLPMPGRSGTITPDAVVSQLRSLYFDVALSGNDQALSPLLALVDHRRIVFGSDFPFAPERVVADVVDGFATSGLLTRDQSRGIAHDNAETLLDPGDHQGEAPAARPEKPPVARKEKT
ncbi:amidohydrolase family protein [Polymorphospora sp. NPDC051019]|uniref:amidohydrolase family protein n=1 Tax=Polymorphospora sp. NPDC051019 TaxID=3155725 RepID=UPI003427E8B8